MASAIAATVRRWGWSMVNHPEFMRRVQGLANFLVILGVLFLCGWDMGIPS